MATKTEPAVLRGDREIVVTRMFDAPRELVFRAWTEQQHLTQWWGPNGFTITTKTFEFKEGGVWQFTMHGPDGRDYQNKLVFETIKRPERLVYHHPGEVTNRGWPINETEAERATYEAAFAGMEMGFKGTLDQLEAYLAKAK